MSYKDFPQIESCLSPSFIARGRMGVWKAAPILIKLSQFDDTTAAKCFSFQLQHTIWSTKVCLKFACFKARYCSILLDFGQQLEWWSKCVKNINSKKAMIAVTPATPDPLGSRNTRCRVCFVLCCSFANATNCIKFLQSLALGQRNVFQYDVWVSSRS